MEKLPDWIDRLALLIRQRRHDAFEWGRNDCLSWAADAVQAQTGLDTLVDYRGHYSTHRGAVKALRQVRERDLRRTEELADLLWGPRLPIARAQLGDVVMAAAGEPAGLGMSAGICYGRNSFFVGTDAGRVGLVALDTFSLEHCYKPWASLSKP